jgi:hypothetical protein
VKKDYTDVKDSTDVFPQIGYVMETLNVKMVTMKKIVQIESYFFQKNNQKNHYLPKMLPK